MPFETKEGRRDERRRERTPAQWREPFLDAQMKNEGVPHELLRSQYIVGALLNWKTYKENMLK